jgi:UDP-glucose 4-epimerase
MKILITGGAGYVGSACLRHVVSMGHDAVAYDNLVEGHPGAVGGSRLVVGDIADTEKLTQTLREFGADAVMHFAAATYVGGSLSLLNAMRAAGVGRMLFSSTCATYGMADAETMSEDTPQAPFSPYARTKLAVEWMIRDFAHAYGLGFTLLRYFNASGGSPDGKFGEYHNPETHLIPLVLEVPLGRRKEIKVYGNDYPTPDGTCIRDYVHIDDLASAHLLAIERTRQDSSAVFNIGTGDGQSVLQIIQACERVCGQSIPYQVVERRPGDPPRLVADPRKLKGELGWVPKYTSIDDTIRTAWAFHQKNPEGYQPPKEHRHS